jgi:hypothetical protein
MKVVARRYFPAPPPGTPSPPPLWESGVLERIARDAGLVPDGAFDVRWAYEFADAHALTRSMLAVAGLAVSVGPDRLGEVRDEIVEALAPYRTAGGGYRLENEFRFLVARV